MSESCTYANFKIFQVELLSCCIECEIKIVRMSYPILYFKCRKVMSARRIEVVTIPLSLVARLVAELGEEGGGGDTPLI